MTAKVHAILSTLHQLPSKKVTSIFGSYLSTYWYKNNWQPSVVCTFHFFYLVIYNTALLYLKKIPIADKYFWCQVAHSNYWYLQKDFLWVVLCLCTLQPETIQFIRLTAAQWSFQQRNYPNVKCVSCASVSPEFCGTMFCIEENFRSRHNAMQRVRGRKQMFCLWFFCPRVGFVFAFYIIIKHNLLCHTDVALRGLGLVIE